MGVDVNLYVVGDVTNEQIEAAEGYLRERLGAPDDYFQAWLTRSDFEPGRVEFGTLDRYYGPGYERGNWPRIYGYLRALHGALPAASLHYGGDGDDDCPEATDAYLAEIWDHWIGPHGQDYRNLW